MKGDRLQRSKRMSRLRRLAALAGLLACWPWLAFASEADLYSRLQAAYLFKIANYVSWPQPIDAHYFSVCVVDQDDAFADGLRASLKGRALHKKPVQVARILAGASTADFAAAQCQLVYLKATLPAETLTDWQAHAQDEGHSVLWVSSPQWEPRASVLFQMALENERIAIYLSKTALASTGLQVAPALLTVAKPR